MPDRIPNQRLDLRKPQYVPRGHFEPNYRRIADLNNTILRRLFEETQEDFPSPTVQIPRLVATVRWSILEQTAKACGRVAGVKQAALRRLEQPRENSKAMIRSTVRLLLDFWQQQGIPETIREQLLDLFQERDGGIHGFYRRMAFERPCDHVPECDPCTLSSREALGLVPKYCEVRRIVQDLYPGRGKPQADLRERRLEQGREAWHEARLAQLRDQRELEEPLACLLCAVEVYLAEQEGTTPTIRSLSKELGLTEENAGNLLNGVLLPWDSIAPLARTVLGRQQSEELREVWEQEWTRERKRERFGTAVGRIRDANGLRNQDFAYALGIKAPEERDPTYAADRSEGYRRSAEIRHVLDLGAISEQVPIRALSAVASRGNEPWQEHLHTLFLEERKRHYTRATLNVRGGGQELRITREYNGVTSEELALAYLGQDTTPSEVASLAKRIVNFEGGIIRGDAFSARELRSFHRLTGSLGERRVEIALERLRVLEDAKQQRQRFREQFLSMRNARGIHNNVDLGYALGIRPTEIDRMLRHESIGGSVCPRALITLVIQGDDASKRILERSFRTSQAAARIRTGAELGTSLDLHVELAFNGTSAEELASHLLREDAERSEIVALRDRIQSILAGRVPPEQLRTEELDRFRNGATAIGEERVKEALLRWRGTEGVPEQVMASPYASIHEAARAIVEGAGGFVPAARLLCEQTDDRHLRLSWYRMKRMSEGSHYPPFPIVEHCMERFGIEVTEEMRHDWFSRFPEQLQRQNNRIGYRQPLPRLLLTLIHAHETTLRKFSEDRLPDVSQSTVSHTIVDLEHRREKDWRYVAQILTAAEVEANSIPWELARLLHNGKTAAQAIQVLRPRLRREGCDIHPINLPGLTLREIARATRKTR